MKEYVSFIVFTVLIMLLYVNNSAMGSDNECAALDRVRNSSGYLIKYHGQEN